MWVFRRTTYSVGWPHHYDGLPPLPSPHPQNIKISNIDNCWLKGLFIVGSHVSSYFLTTRWRTLCRLKSFTVKTPSFPSLSVLSWGSNSEWTLSEFHPYYFVIVSQIGLVHLWPWIKLSKMWKPKINFLVYFGGNLTEWNFSSTRGGYFKHPCSFCSFFSWYPAGMCIKGEKWKTL